MPFEFSTADRILFGPGVALAGVAAMAELGNRVLVVTGSRPRRWRALLQGMRERGIAVTMFAVEGEPTTDIVETAVRCARQADCDMVAGIGGGSVMDTAKAVAALVTNTDPLTDYLEVIGRGSPLQHPPVPCVVFSTTAGTGAEVTRNAVLAAPAHHVKVSLRSPLMLPRLAVVDPELHLSLPAGPTAATGMDALTQLVEAYLSRKANPLTDALCREGLLRCARSLETAFGDGGNLAARTDMALAALFSGLALANGGLGAVHGIAGPLGGRWPIPHGAICGCLLPHVFQANWRRLQAAPDASPVGERFAEVARLLTGEAAASPAEGSAWLQRLGRSLRLPTLSSYGLTTADLPGIAAGALKASSMAGNPVTLEPADIIGILAEAL